jgi:hypothetical protein
MKLTTDFHLGQIADQLTKEKEEIDYTNKNILEVPGGAGLTVKEIKTADPN